MLHFALTSRKITDQYVLNSNDYYNILLLDLKHLSLLQNQTRKKAVELIIYSSHLAENDGHEEEVEQQRL